MPLSDADNPSALVLLWRHEKAAWRTSLREAAHVGRDLRVGWSVAVFGIAICAFLYWRNIILEQQPKFVMDFNEYNLLNIACILGLPLIFILLFLRRRTEKFGMKIGDAPAGLWYVLAAFVLFFPVQFLSGGTRDAQMYYLPWLSNGGGSGAFVYATRAGFPFVPEHINYARLAYHELVMCFYMFGWEFFFRGFLLSGFRRFLPLWPAIALQTIFFFILHVGKPTPELLSSLPGGVLMALLAIRCRSFVPCFLLHFLISSAYDCSVLTLHFHPFIPHLLSHRFPSVFGLSLVQK